VGGSLSGEPGGAGISAFSPGSPQQPWQRDEDGSVVEGEASSTARRAGVQQQNHGPATVTTTRYVVTTIRTMRWHLR
jgi:hypothetical protein